MTASLLVLGQAGRASEPWTRTDWFLLLIVMWLFFYAFALALKGSRAARRVRATNEANAIAKAEALAKAEAARVDQERSAAVHSARNERSFDIHVQLSELHIKRAQLEIESLKLRIREQRKGLDEFGLHMDDE